jgi:hypothetical protein
VAEKLAAMNTAAFFAKRRERDDLKAFDRPAQGRGSPAARRQDRLTP